MSRPIGSRLVRLLLVVVMALGVGAATNGTSTAEAEPAGAPEVVSCLAEIGGMSSSCVRFDRGQTMTIARSSAGVVTKTLSVLCSGLGSPSPAGIACKTAMASADQIIAAARVAAPNGLCVAQTIAATTPLPPTASPEGALVVSCQGDSVKDRSKELGR